jgi:3D (Asp-Asp-Asp) domain-containing protein
MVKDIVSIIIIGGASVFCTGQYPYEKFDPLTERFDTSIYSEFYLLTAKVEAMGEINWTKDIPEDGFDLFMSLLYEDYFAADVRRKNLLKGYLKRQNIFDVGGSLDSAVCTNSKGNKARYFVIHDTSFPNYLEEDFPDDMNDSSWQYNDLPRYFGMENGRNALAHAFINREGKIYSQLDLSVPWRATKLELKKIEESISKGLFIHIELVQPRKSDTSKWDGNDIVAPAIGFTTQQYESLAILYVAASVRAGNWLIPAFHAVLDSGLKGAHDDPQNFDNREFRRMLNHILQQMDANHMQARYFGFEQPDEEIDRSKLDLWATWYYVPVVESVEGGIPLLNSDEKETGFYLDSCRWCNAVIEGTVIFETDSGNVVMNYAGRSENIQHDCRSCPELKNYAGFEKSGKVLFTESMDFGQGVEDYYLVPYRSIATDPDVIPHGTVIHIPEAVGTVIEYKGERYAHDGYFFAADAGSAIKGNHIDVFIGTETKNPFDFVKSRESFSAFVIQNAQIKLNIRNLHIIP